MENSATLNAPKTDPQPQQSPQPQPAATDAPASEPQKIAIPTPKRTMMELLRELTECGGDRDLWKLTYMLHAEEIFQLKEQEAEDSLSVRLNYSCGTKTPWSFLEYCSRCNAEKKNGFSYYFGSCNYGIKNLKSKCSYCKDDIAFCPHKMAAYIQLICQGNSLDIQQVYRLMLGDSFEQKPEFAQFRELDIPRESYDFLDAVSVSAAAELLKLKLITPLNAGERYMRYSYVPVCEQSNQSRIKAMLAHYRTRDGKQEMLSLTDPKQDVCRNRSCAKCIFPQCPDKVAAYLLQLSDRFAVDVMELAEFVSVKNKIGGVTLRGNFRYYHNLRRLDDIPFTADSRQTLNRITRYVVNKYAVGKHKVPFLPLHMLILTKDEQLADDTVQILRDFLLYYNYMVDLQKTVEYKFSEGGLAGLLKTIKAQEKPVIIHVKEIGLLANETDARQTTMQMTQLTNLVEEKREKVLLVVSGEKKKLDTALGAYNDFYQGTLGYRLTITDMSPVRVVQAVLEELKKQYALEEGFETALEYYVLAKYGESPLKSKAFIQSTVQTIQFNHYNQELNAENKLLLQDIPATSSRRSDEEIWSELNELTGLDTVKEEIRTIDQLLKFQKKLQNLGNKGMARPNMHMVFSGNPGTGKTTVARLMAEIFYNVGFIKQNKLIEVSAKDLIGQYIGHTAPQTAAVCESAYGGVLFIDEAYELTVRDNTGSANFRSECIAELIKQMEDNRDRLIVIFAGYTKEMEELLASNAGFASRIGRIIRFPDYSEHQLLDMFVRLVHKNGMGIDEKARNAALLNITVAGAQPHFGNGRYVRNLFERTIMEHARNMVAVDDAELLTQIMEDDIPMI